MKIIKLLIACVFLTSCVKDITPPAFIPPAPVKVESVLPTINTIDKRVSELGNTNSKLEEKIKVQNQAILAQKVSVSNALAQAEKIKEQVLANEAITQIQTVDLIDELTKVGERNMFLETENGSLETIRKDQEATLQKLQTDVSEAQQKASQKEREADELRNQNTFYGTTLAQKNQDVANLQKELEKTKVQAASAKVYRNWIWGLVGGFILYNIIKNVLLIYFPMIKFRV